jgi:hypothetical protein
MSVFGEKKNITLRKEDPLGRTRSKGENNFKIYFGDTGLGVWGLD